MFPFAAKRNGYQKMYSVLSATVTPREMGSEAQPLTTRGGGGMSPNKPNITSVQKVGRFWVGDYITENVSYSMK